MVKPSVLRMQRTHQTWVLWGTLKAGLQPGPVALSQGTINPWPIKSW